MTSDLAKPTLVRGGALSPSAWTGAAAPVRPDFSTHDAFSERLRKHITTGSGTDEGYGSAPITAPSLPLAALPGDGVGDATRDDTDFMLAATRELRAAERSHKRQGINTLCSSRVATPLDSIMHRDGLAQQAFVDACSKSSAQND